MTQKTTVPLLDLRAQYESIKDEVDEAVHRVLDRQGFVLGPEVEALERRLAEYCQAQHAIGCASGSDALLLALMAHRVGPGDEVIRPSWTFYATAGSIAVLGATPVFVDIDPVTYNIRPDRVRERAAAYTRLRAIIPVDMYGQCAEMNAFVDLGEQFRVPIIEDAAQAIGARDAEGMPAGSRGSVGCFSFYPTKNLGGIGDGGMVTANDPNVAERLRKIRVHGERKRYYHDLIGFNSRLDALQAAVLNVKLRYLDGWSSKRRENARHYDAAFAVAGIPGLETPQHPAGMASHIYHQYVIRVPAEHRDALREHLRDVGIGTEVYYPVPLHLQECFEYLGYSAGDLPESEKAALETLALPIYPELTTEQLDYVPATIIAYLQPRVSAAQASGTVASENRPA